MIVSIDQHHHVIAIIDQHYHMIVSIDQHYHVIQEKEISHPHPLCFSDNMETRRQLAACMKGVLGLMLLLGIFGIVLRVKESPHAILVIEAFVISATTQVEQARL